MKLRLFSLLLVLVLMLSACAESDNDRRRRRDDDDDDGLKWAENQIGDMLNFLVDAVTRHPEFNTKETLLELVNRK